MFNQKYSLLKMCLICGIAIVGMLNDESTSLAQPTASDRILVPGRNEFTIEQTIDGSIVQRTVYITAPENLSSEQSYPVVFAFHGAGGSGNQFLNNPSLNQLITAGEFIGVYPNGHANEGVNGRFWNLGTEPTTADDVEFVNLIMERLASYSELDLSNVFGMGFSNGAGMINLLGKSTSHFVAIAPLFSQQSISTGELTPLRSLSVIQINGEVDPLIPLNGGPSQVGEFMSAQDSALNWAEEFNCSTTPVEESFVWGSTSIDSFTFSGCDSDHEVKYLIALGAPHGWDDREADERSFQEIWAFFEERLQTE